MSMVVMMCMMFMMFMMSMMFMMFMKIESKYNDGNRVDLVAGWRGVR